MQRSAVVYTRFSPRPDAAESESLQAQSALCRNYAVAQGWTIEMYFEDAAVTGATREGRKGLRAMLDYLKANPRKQVVLCYAMSRISRSVLDLLNLAEELEGMGNELVCVKDQLDTTTPMGRFTFTIFGALNQLEREQISARTSDAMRTMVLRGRSTGTLPHGFRIVRQEVLPSGRTRTWIGIDPENMRAYHRLAAMRERGGSLGQCARWLNEEGLLVNGAWTKDRVRRALEAIERYNLLDTPVGEKEDE